VDPEYHLGDHRRADHRAAGQVRRPRPAGHPDLADHPAGIVGALTGNWLAAPFGVRFTGGIDWIRHILQVGAAAVLIATIAPVWMRRGAGRGV
jgi:uncharacterized membrane protein YeaQ/YmgE (transglycosylase-associated protein family)